MNVYVINFSTLSSYPGHSVVKPLARKWDVMSCRAKTKGNERGVSIEERVSGKRARIRAEYKAGFRVVGKGGLRGQGNGER